jgi:predicted XRE-type DNA-binding protein
MTNKHRPDDTIATDIADELAVWLPTAPITRTTPAEWTHPDDPNFAARVAARTEELRNEHHVVSSLAELRRAASLTQTQLAARWGRGQSRVSHLESSIRTVEMGSLLEYVHALGGTLEIRVTVADHTYIEQLA